MAYFKFDVIPLNQKIGKFFLGKMTPRQLHRIANRYLSRYQDLENGIQREISVLRKNRIKEYLQEDDYATFPNTIIIAVSADPGSKNPAYILNENEKTLEILDADGVANIIDGQHRLSGFSETEENFELPVAIFLDISLELQAKTFAKINSTQVKVPLDLVYDLYGITSARSTEKTAYSIVKKLNTQQESPWYGRIKTLTERKRDIAQGSFAKYIDIRLISDGRPLRKLYLEERDEDIYTLIKEYFSVVKDTFPQQWENEDRNYILTKTTGFVGFMMFFIDLLKLAKQTGLPLKRETFKSRIGQVSENFDEFTSEFYQSGGQGQSKIRTTLQGSLTEEEKSLIGVKI